MDGHRRGQSLRNRIRPAARRAHAEEAALLDRDELQDFLDAYGRELVSGDLDGVAARYTYPVCVVGENANLSLSAPGELKATLTGAARRYEERGVAELGMELRGVEELTEHLVWVDVRRTALAADGTEVLAEGRRYLLRMAGGSCMICVVVPTGPA